MRKTIYKVLIMSLVLLTYSCQKEETKELVSKREVQGPSAKQYQTDAKVLQEFVRIDKVNNRYYLDLETKDQQTAAIPKKVVEQSQQISTVHKKQFVDELEQLNNFIREQTKNQADYVVMETSHDSYSKQLSDSPSIIASGKSTNAKTLKYTPIGSFELIRPNQGLKPFEIYGNDEVFTSIYVGSNSMTNNVAAILTCETGTTVQEGKTTTTVVVTTTHYSISKVFDWKNTKTGKKVYWKFQGTHQDRPDIESLTRIFNGRFNSDYELL